MKKKKFDLITLALFTVCIAIGSCSPLPKTPLDNSGSEPAFDPVRADPEVTDSEHPPISVGGSIELDGTRLNTFWMQPGGPGPHPTIILLHGLPGNEKNLDLARVLQRAGFNILYFNYRGSWGSGGYFTLSSALEDVLYVIEFVRTKCHGECEEASIDPDRIALLGHSMGALLGLIAVAEGADVACTAALDFWNVGADGKFYRAQLNEHGPDEEWEWKQDWEGWKDFDIETMTEGSPVKAEFQGAFTSDWMANLDRFDPVTQAASLAGHPLFLISTHEDYYPFLVEALNESGAKHLTAEMWDTDHSFSSMRVRLSDAMVEWYTNECGLVP